MEKRVGGLDYLFHHFFKFQISNNFMHLQLMLTVFLLIFAGFFINIPNVFAQQFGEWQTLPNMTLSRSDYTGNVVGTDIYLIQGFNALTNMTKYDTLTGIYTELKEVPYGAHHSSSGYLNGKIYVAGGHGCGTFCTNFTRYNIAADTWETLPNMPMGTAAATAQFVGNTFYIIGGQPDKDACQKYEVISGNWSTCADMPTGREHLSSAVFNNHIYVINGRGGDSGDATANEVYVPGIDTWFERADKPTGMSGGWGGVADGKIYVIGGEGPLTGANEWYDPVSNTWQVREEMPTQRHGVVCGTVANSVYCFGGGEFNGGGIGDTVEVYNFFPTVFCSPPVSGDWLINSSCTLDASSSAPGNVSISSGVVLTIPNGLSLDIDFLNFGLTVISGGGVNIQAGGTIE